MVYPITVSRVASVLLAETVQQFSPQKSYPVIGEIYAGPRGQLILPRLTPDSVALVTANAQKGLDNEGRVTQLKKRLE